MVEQISSNRGRLKCKKGGARVEITRETILFMKGEIYI